jgi:cysteinyl-tRNA synthetase
VRRAGIRAAVIPHYNNAEGGTHDTRFCYMGERRLRVLESMLPDGCGILGIDEHTACIIDVDAASLTVRGRGRVIWRRHGTETHWRAPEVVSLADLTSAAHGAPHHPDRVAPLDDEPGGSGDGADGHATPFMEEVSDQRDTALRAIAARDPDGAAEAMLAMETTLHEWSSDPLQSDEPDRARASLRELVVRLADLARTGSMDPRERVAPLVDAVLGLRDQARSAGRFADADALRDALVSSGVAVHDTPQGSTWELTE